VLVGKGVQSSTVGYVDIVQNQHLPRLLTLHAELQTQRCRRMSGLLSKFEDSRFSILFWK